MKNYFSERINKLVQIRTEKNNDHPTITHKIQVRNPLQNLIKYCEQFSPRASSDVTDLVLNMQFNLNHNRLTFQIIKPKSI